MGLWSGVQMISTSVSLGEIHGVFLDGSDRRIVVRPISTDWLVAFLEKNRRTGKVDVELDRAAITIKGMV
ncbi:MAG: hypothetical protein GF411_20045 [Candidatus Lokiarchaeota archaeon]|nr:hypothetical protein [Candidatus Lokiarchaeota archaeon]